MCVSLVSNHSNASVPIEALTAKSCGFLSRQDDKFVRWCAACVACVVSVGQ